MHIDTLAKAIAIADRSVISDIECQGVRIGALGDRVYDLSAMFDPREQPGEWIDMFAQAIDYALSRGLIEVDAKRPRVVRIRAPLR